MVFLSGELDRIRLRLHTLAREQQQKALFVNRFGCVKRILLNSIRALFATSALFSLFLFANKQIQDSESIGPMTIPIKSGLLLEKRILHLEHGASNATNPQADLFTCRPRVPTGSHPYRRPFWPVHRPNSLITLVESLGTDESLLHNYVMIDESSAQLRSDHDT